MKIETLLRKQQGLIAVKGDFKPKIILSASKVKSPEGGCQDYAMGVLGLPHYSWEASQSISIPLREGKLPELSRINLLEEECLITFYRKEKFYSCFKNDKLIRIHEKGKFHEYAHYGIVRKRRKRNNSPWLFVVESMCGVYNPVSLKCIEELQRYGDQVDLYRRNSN